MTNPAGGREPEKPPVAAGAWCVFSWLDRWPTCGSTEGIMANFATDELILAFTYDILLKMEQADGVADPAEQRLREETFPSTSGYSYQSQFHTARSIWPT